jgi:transcriptional regulator with XRE-family HTH domain
MMSI